MAYMIARRYYNDRHFVWCTTDFHSPQQPPTSDPQTICNSFLRQMKTGDRHERKIEDNKSGILRGAREKLAEGVITQEQYNEIKYKIRDLDKDEFDVILFSEVLQDVMEVADRKAGE